MPPFQPDVESLIRPIRIDKPQEEFLLPGVAPNAPGAELPTPVLRSTPFVARLDQRQELLLEAARVQELLDLLAETTPDIEVSLPEEDQPLLGAVTVTTKEYLAAAGAEQTQDAVRRRHHFEWGLLQGCGGASSNHWPVLAAPDLHLIRNDLLDAANVVEGVLLERTPLRPAQPSDWHATASGSHLTVINDSLLAGSQSYRLKLAQATFTMKQGQMDELLQRLLDPLLSAPAARLRPVILEVINAMKALRNLLCHTAFLRAAEYRTVRDALLSLFEAALLKQLLSTFLVILGRAEQALIAPVLHMFEHGLGEGGILELLGAAASQEIAAVAGSTMLSLKRRYNDQAADLIRALESRSEKQLTKLHVLGERNLINRWVEQLDQGILILRRALSQQTNLSRELAGDVAQRVLRRLEAPKSTFLERLSQHPELAGVQGTRLFNREFTPLPLLGLDGKIQGSFGDLHLATPDFSTGNEELSARPAFTGVDAAGRQNRVS